MSETDEMIINRVLSGDRNAYSFLVDRYKDRVYSLVCGVVRNDETAKEIAQDVFVKAFTSLNKFRKESSFSTWIYRIAYNTSVSELRKSKKKVHSFDEQLEKLSSLDMANTKVDEDEMENKKSILHQAIQKLSAEERLIIMLYYFEEQSIEEISQSSGLSRSNVKIRLFRLRNKLKDIMQRIGVKELAVY